MRTLLEDVRFALRQMRKNPGYSLTTLLILAIGIGASTAIFSAVNPILFEPLPYPAANRILMVWDIFQGARSDVSFHNFREIAERNRSFEAVAVMWPWHPAMTGSTQPFLLDGQRVSSEYFRALGVHPALGRDFTVNDDTPHAPKVVMLSDRVWHEQFSGDPTIVGRQIRLDSDLVTIIGVMPASFVNVLDSTATVWSPLAYDTAHITDFDSEEWGHHLHMIARLRPGVTMPSAIADLVRIAHSRVPEFPRPPFAAMSRGFIVNRLQSEVTRGVKPALLAVLGAVALLLFIAATNVTNLLLARGAQRRGEFAMRSALGASRTRLTRQLVTEAVLLAVLGGALGLLVADIGVKGLVALSPPGLPRVDAIGLHWPVFVFATILVTLVGIAVGLVPGWQLFRHDLHPSLQQAGGRTTTGHEWTRRTLVVTEVSLALVLLVGAGLLLHSLQRLFSVDPGLDSSHVVTMQVQTVEKHFATEAAKQQFFAQSLEAVQHLPGSVAAGYTSLLPLGGDPYGVYGLHIEGSEGGAEVYRYAVAPGYFPAAGIRLLRGRLLDEHDNAGNAPAVVVSESLAKSKFPNDDAVGKRIHVGPVNRPWFTIVGVVADVKQASLAESEPFAVYLPETQSWFADDAMSLVVRTKGDPTALVPLIKNAVWSVDREQPVERVQTLDALLATSEAQRRFALLIFEVFAAVGLLLAMAGIYGVLSVSVVERTREMGIRTALGATRRDLLRLVVRQGMLLAGVGALIGISASVLASRALASMLFGVSRLDPLTYLAVLGLLLIVSALACWAPAWRASKVDPAVILRAE